MVLAAEAMFFGQKSVLNLQAEKNMELTSLMTNFVAATSETACLGEQKKRLECSRACENLSFAIS